MTGKELGVIERLRSHRAAVVGIAILLVAALACVGFALASQGQEGRDGGEETPEEEYVLNISVEADGWDAETSSKVIIHVEGDGVDFYHAFDANDANATIAVPKAGDYTVTFISPVNSDGSIYRVPDAATVTATVKDDSTTTKVTPTYKFTKVEASDVTADDLNNIVNQVSEAVKKGDSTLTGENGVAVVEKVKENAKANQNADQTAIENTANTAETDAASGASQATGTVSNSTSGNTSSTSNSNSNSNSGSSNSSTSESHTHSYTTVHHDAVYTTVHHDAVYTTVHHDAVTETQLVCNACGLTVSSQAETQSHKKEAALAGDTGHTFHSETVTTQAAYDEQVLVTAAYDEQVLVTAAYDETVCTVCGQKK